MSPIKPAAHSSPLLIAIVVYASLKSSIVCGSVDFSPLRKEIQFDGTTSTCVAFQAGASRIEYNPPWPISGQGSRANLAVPVSGAQANIQRVLCRGPLAFSQDTALLDLLKLIIPKDAEKVELGPVVRNPVKISGKETAEIIATYVVFGRRVQLSTLLAQREPGQEAFLFQVSSAPSDFKQVHRQFQASLYSIVGF